MTFTREIRMKQFVIISQLLVTLAFLLGSCEKPNIIEDPEKVEYLYSNAPDTQLIQNSRYRFEAELYRDFFPGGPFPRKTPLIAYVSLIRLDSLAIPGNIDISTLYVIYDQQIWISDPENVHNPSNPADYVLSKVSNDGPEWTTGNYVNVIALVTDKNTNSKYYIIARHRKIERVE
jgi:hypothetical protein